MQGRPFRLGRRKSWASPDASSRKCGLFQLVQSLKGNQLPQQVRQEERMYGKGKSSQRTTPHRPPTQHQQEKRKTGVLSSSPPDSKSTEQFPGSSEACGVGRRGRETDRSACAKVAIQTPPAAFTERRSAKAGWSKMMSTGTNFRNGHGTGRPLAESQRCQRPADFTKASKNSRERLAAPAKKCAQVEIPPPQHRRRPSRPVSLPTSSSPPPNIPIADPPRPSARTARPSPPGDDTGGGS